MPDAPLTSAEIAAIAAEHEASYSGWGTPVKPAAPASLSAEQIVRETAEADFAVRGWGTPSLGGVPQTEEELARVEAAAIDNAFGPPPTPAHYVLPHIPDLDPKADTALRGMLHAAELDQGAAHFFVDRYLATVHGKPEVSDEQLKIDTATARVSLERLFGDQTDAKIADARAEVRRIARDHPAILDILRSPLGNDPMVIQRLALVAELRRGRAARRGKK